MAITAVPIQPVKTVSGNQPAARRFIEDATQTFKLGTPVAIAAADGGIIAWNGTTVLTGNGAVVGISYEAASNLASTGLGAPQPNQPVTGLGAAVTFGSVPNEASAKNIPHGAPLNDGRVGIFLAAFQDTIFSATLGNNGNTANWADSLLSTGGALAGLTIDSGANFWYVDLNKTNEVRIVGRDLRDPIGAGNRVLFQFLSTAIQQL
jgi:hypothetical protein